MWRYKLLAIAGAPHDASRLKACEAALNELGRDGWDAVAVIPQSDGSCWVLLKMPHEAGTY